MSEKKDKNYKQSDVQIAREISARNRSAKQFSRWMILKTIFSFVSFVIATLMLIAFSTRSAPPRYIPTDNEMRYNAPVQKKVREGFKSDQDISTFVLSAVTELFTYDWVNSKTQINKNQVYFTDRGWQGFVKSINEAKLIHQVVAAKQISSFELDINSTKNPIRVLPKENNGLITIVSMDKDGKSYQEQVAYWDVEIHGILKYTSGSVDGVAKREIKRTTMLVRVVRTSTMDKAEGVAINRFILSYK